MARNVGVAASSGEFVAFLDEDYRLFHASRLEWQRKTLDAEPDAAMCFGRYQYVDAEGKILASPLGDAVSQRESPGVQFPLLSSLMVRRSAVMTAGGFDPTLRTCEDIDFYLRVFMRHSAALPRGNQRLSASWCACRLGTWDLNPVFEKHRRWAEAAGRAEIWRPRPISGSNGSAATPPGPRST